MVAVTFRMIWMIQFAFAASANPDIMYLDEAMRADDSAQFRKAMGEEVKSLIDNNHWQIVKRIELPLATKILPSV
jgi:ABC-type polysaccharide/polyol phosphate transport system ATPase subunit